MKIFNKINLLESQTATDQVALAIGNFDGCHLGHQKLLSETLRAAKEMNLIPAVLTFDPRPESFFAKRSSDILLFTLDQKIRALEENKIENIYIQNFDEKFSQVSAEDFVKNILLEKLNAQVVVIGDEFHFGRNRSGDVEFLKKIFTTLGKSVNAVDVLSANAERKIGSRSTRDLISQTGNMEEATRLLGRPYLLEGKVIHGQKRGRTIGIPTMNLDYHRQQILPKFGVYACYVVREKEIKIPVTHLPEQHNLYPAVVNVGQRPTVDQSVQVHVEAHIIQEDFKKDVYDEYIGIYFCKRLRDEQKFSSLDSLKNQIQQDIFQAKSYFG